MGASAMGAAMQSARDANEVLRLVEKGRNLVQWYGLLPVLQGGYLGSSWWQALLLQDPSMQQRMQSLAVSRHNVVLQQARTLRR